MSSSAAPVGFNSVTVYMVLENAAAELEFIEKVFNGVARDRVTDDTGGIMHAEMYIGGSMVMLADATDEHQVCTAMLYVYVDDVDETYKAALAAGADSVQEPADQHYGDRTAGVVTDRGVKWYIGTRQGSSS